jgi:predicted transcriptional regulator
MELASMDGKNAKHHLDALEKAGLIESYLVGRKKYYRLIKEVRLEISPPPEGRFILYTTN